MSDASLREALQEMVSKLEARAEQDEPYLFLKVGIEDLQALLAAHPQSDGGAPVPQQVVEVSPTSPVPTSLDREELLVVLDRYIRDDHDPDYPWDGSGDLADAIVALTRPVNEVKAKALRDAAEYFRSVDMPEAADLLENLADGWAGAS